MFGWRKGHKSSSLEERPQPHPTVLGAPDQGPDGKVFGSRDYSPPTLSTTEPSPEMIENGARLGESNRDIGQQVLRSTKIDEQQ